MVWTNSRRRFRPAAGVCATRRMPESLDLCAPAAVCVLVAVAAPMFVAPLVRAASNRLANRPSLASFANSARTPVIAVTALTVATALTPYVWFGPSLKLGVTTRGKPAVAAFIFDMVGGYLRTQLGVVHRTAKHDQFANSDSAELPVNSRNAADSEPQ